MIYNPLTDTGQRTGKIEADTLILAARGDGADDVPTSFDNSEDKGLTRYELRRVPR